MDEKHGIDKFFKTMFEHGDTDQPWLVPEDAVFERAMELVDQKRKRRRFFWLFPGLIALIVCTVCLLWWDHARIHTLEQRLDAIATTEFLKAGRQFDAFGHNFAPGTEKNNAENPAPYLAKSRQYPATSQQTGHNAIGRTRLRPAPSQLQRTAKQTPKPGQQATRSIPAIGIGTEVHQQHLPLLSAPANDSSPNIGALETPIRPLVFTREPELHRYPVTATTKKARPGWEATLTGGIRWSAFEMRPVDPNGPLTEYDKYYLGYFAGIELSKSIANRWQVFLALNGDKVTNRSIYKTDKQFDVADLTVGSTGMRYKSDVPVMTPLSNRTQQLDLDMDMSNIQDQDIFDCVLQSKHDIWLISAGAGIRYSVWKNQRFDLGLETAFQYQWVLSARESTDFQMYHKSKMLYQEGNQFDIRTNTAKGFATLRLGLFSKVYWNDKMFSGLTLSHDRALSPMTKTSGSGTGSTYVHGLRIGIVTGVRF